MSAFLQSNCCLQQKHKQPGNDRENYTPLTFVRDVALVEAPGANASAPNCRTCAKCCLDHEAPQSVETKKMQQPRTAAQRSIRALWPRCCRLASAWWKYSQGIHFGDQLGRRTGVRKWEGVVGVGWGDWGGGVGFKGRALYIAACSALRSIVLWLWWL